MRDSTNSSNVPRVLIDGYFFDRPYGFGRYVRELVYALDKCCTELEAILLVPSALERKAVAATTRTRVVSRPVRFFPVWEQVVVPRVARSLGCGLVHFPYQSTALLWPRSGCVTTIHDLMFLRPTGTATALKDHLAHLYRRVLFTLQSKHAGRLIAVSEQTRVELQQAGARATVIENVCEAFVATHAHVPPASDQGRFFLHRGASGPHKNTRRVILAFARVRRAHPGVRLLVYGDPGGEDLLRGLPLDGVVLLGKVDDVRLAALYKAAIAVVAPSLEEGFGLSLIEAFGFGTTVVTSDRSPMRDVTETAGICVDPTRIDAIAQSMRRLLQEPHFRSELVERARRRYAHFSAARLAAALQEIYAPVAGPGRSRSLRTEVAS